jgi:hypothetical protein
MTAATPWPTDRSTRSAVVAQFGDARADLMQWALTTGDPLADALVVEMHEQGMRQSRELLDRGLREGLALLDDPPPALAALLTQTESRPPYATDELIDDYSRPFFTSPGPVHMVSLSAGSLVRAYESPSIARVLSLTGRLVEGAPRRIQETGKWLLTVMLPGSLRPGQAGYQATIQVRMVHAHMRKLAYERGYDATVWGVPINQVDLGRTWMDFTLTSYTAEQEFGFALTGLETESLYRYWWYIGHLLGVDPRLVAGITNHEAAKRVADLFQTVTGSVSEESAVLADATLGSTTASLHQIMHVPTGLARPVVNAIARRIHGPGTARDLKIEVDPTADLFLTPAVKALRAARDRRRDHAERWAADIDKNIAETRNQLVEFAAGSTAYERGATTSDD